jgi:glucuronoarabinoxylan endo-1,4-beta-xylanase
MHRSTTPFTIAVALSALPFFVAACSSSETPPLGSGGSFSSGGINGAGGTASPSGGSSSSGGNSAPAGGSSSSGGGSPAGGSGPSGGAVGSGGAGTGSGAAVGGGDGSGGSTPSGVAVKLDATHQTIQGFGVNTALMPSGKSVPINTIFDTTGTDGIGLSILRIGMNSNGSLTGSGIAEARAKGAKIIGSTWSPPANCKSNNSTQNGGHLLESCFNSWATTIANFADQQNLYAMSIANESDFASCPGVPVCTDAYDTTVYTAKEMVAWVKVAGAKIKEVNPDIKVIAPEASEWVHAWSNLSGTGSLVDTHPHSSDPLDCGCFGNVITAEAEADCAQTCKDGNGYDYGHWLWKDQAAWAAFDIFGVHEYDSQIGFAWPADVNNGVKNKEIWQTEMSGVMHWPEQGPSTDINNGIAVAGWIHSALTVGEASAWLYWWYEAYYQNDNEGLALTQNSSTPAKRFYALGNYSKFVRPDYVAVEVVGNSNADVLLSAYKGPDGTVVVVAINKGATDATIPIAITGGTAPATLTPTVTSATANLVSGTAVPVTGGSFMATLASKTITTFSGK